MAIKIYDSKDAVPEAQREAALALADGKFAVEEPADPSLSDAGKKALEAERARADVAEKARKTAEKKAADLERDRDARAKGISEEELQKIRDAEALARKPIEDELATTKAENRRLKLTDRVQALALKSGIMNDRIKQAMKILDGRTDLTTDGTGIVVLDDDGKVTAETIDKFLSETFKKEAPWFYAGSGASGSGAEGSNGGGDAPAASEATKEAKRREVAGAF